METAGIEPAQHCPRQQQETAERRHFTRQPCPCQHIGGLTTDEDGGW